MTMAETAALFVAGVACLTDLRSARIPNVLTFSAVAAALVFHAAAPGGLGLQAAGLGLLVGLLVFFPFFALGAMGAGDVKLMAALGAWLGWYGAINVALFGAVAGGVLAIIVSLWHGYLGTALANLKRLFFHFWLTGMQPLPELTLDHGKGLRLPYALPIMAGLLVTLWRH
ncbi:MAG TPA: prepilin peptidase [Vicinamibacterales bacterium]|nr:prepilin peptidase [Vicinamibacterales bacterium]